MKKILFSISGIVAVAALVIFSTGALFSDTETSNGNIFTAGSIDLKVDHTKQTYNGVDCKTCSVTIQSDTTNQVVATTGGADPVAFPHPAVDVSSPNPAWQNETALAPAQWVWATDPTLAADTTNDAEYTFEKKFQWNGTAVSVLLNLALASDNGYKIILNGTTIVDKLSTEFNYGSAVNLTGTEETLFKGAMVNGENKLDIIVHNLNRPGGPSGNPAGLLYKLNIHRDAQECAADSAFQQVCHLWTEKDLATGDTFFNFGDVKPADWGTNVISLHVSSNDAYACLLVGNKDDQENTLLSPETAAGDALNTGNPTGFGELSNFLNVFTWRDTNGNGAYDIGETPLGSGPLSTLTSIMSMDSTNSPFLAANTTQNIGLVWCAGTLTTPVPGNAFVCNGSGMGNIAQSDSFTASLTAYAEQVRNNPNFKCSEQQTPEGLTTVRVNSLQPDFTAQGGGGVFSAYIGPSAYGYVSPGSTAVFDGRAAGIIKAGLNIDADGHYWDEGLLGFQVPTVAISTFAGQALTYDVENQSGPNPVWVRIRLVGGTQYQFVPASYGVGGGYHTINAAAGQWQLMNSGNATGPMMTLSQVAAANPGAQVDRVYLTLGMGDSYHVSPGVGTVGWVDKVTIGGVLYDFVQ